MRPDPTQDSNHDTAGAPRLILLNGAPGVGKSTLAERYVDEHPLALDLDIDRIRSLLGRWRDDPMSGGLLARAIAVAAARTHLGAGHDVVVPQLLARPEFVEELRAAAEQAGAVFVEIMLTDTVEGTRARFAERTRLAADPAHVEAAEELHRTGGDARLDRYHADLQTMIDNRPSIRVVRSVHGDIDQTYRSVVQAIKARADEEQRSGRA